MKLIEVTDPSNKVYLLPIGDLHLGANIDFKKFEGYIDWAKKNNAYIFLMGDLFDVATLRSPTLPWEQKMSLNDAMKLLIKTLMPVQKQIVGAVTGNHEERLIKYANFDPTEMLCEMLGIEYAKYSAVIRFRTGTSRTRNTVRPRIDYVFYAHHGKGGGSTPGQKINRAKKLSEIFVGADAYLVGHNHGKGVAEESPARLVRTPSGKTYIEYKRVQFIDCGSFVIYNDSYEEKDGYPPGDTGCPRIRMDGVRKDLHISF